MTSVEPNLGFSVCPKQSWGPDHKLPSLLVDHDVKASKPTAQPYGYISLLDADNFIGWLELPTLRYVFLTFFRKH